MKRMEQMKKTDYGKNKRVLIEIIIFSLITLISGWLGVIIDKVIGEKAGGGQLEGGSLGELIWLILPLLTAIILRVLSKDFKDAGLRLNLKTKWVWYLVAVGIYPVLCILLLVIGSITKSIDFHVLKLDLSISTLAPMLGQLVFLKLFEELPWRSFLAQKLLSLKGNDWLVYLINGFVWSSWHFAYYQVFLPDSYFEQGGIMEGFTRSSVCIIATVVMILWSVMYVELFRLAKSVWPCLLVHIIEDLLLMYVFTSWNDAIIPGRRFLMDTNFGILSVIVLLGAGLILRSIRIKKERLSI